MLTHLSIFIFSVKYLQQTLDHLAETKYGSLSTVMGRYYAMDRDKRMERLKLAYEGLVQGTGEPSSKDAVVQVCYRNLILMMMVMMTKVMMLLLIKLMMIIMMMKMIKVMIMIVTMKKKW